MNIPKPSDVQKRQQATKDSKTVEDARAVRNEKPIKVEEWRDKAKGDKPKFVRKPHLTQRLGSNADLQRMRRDLKKR